MCDRVTHQAHAPQHKDATNRGAAQCQGQRSHKRAAHERELDKGF
jgi:hypothetical protein